MNVLILHLKIDRITIFIRFKLVRGNTLVQILSEGFFIYKGLFFIFSLFVTTILFLHTYKTGNLKSKEIEFTQLIESNQGIVHKVCRIYSDSPEAHEDLFQEIVLQLWKSYDSFKGEAKFSTWMYRVGLNTAITLIRKKNKNIATTSIDSQHYFDLKAHEFDEEKEERLKMLYNSIKKLNDVERALVLLYLEDLPYKDIAQTLGISEVNARVKMNRAKDKLKEMMTTT